MPSRKGSSNKNKKFLLARLQDEYGEQFHPIMNMAKNAVELQRIVDTLPENVEKGSAIIEASKLWEGLAQYVEPKLKAIEHNVGDGSEGTLTITWK